MRYILLLFFGICLTISLAACANKGAVKEGIYNGIYRGANQFNETRSQDDPPVAAETPLSYEAYQRQRQTMRSDPNER